MSDIAQRIDVGEIAALRVSQWDDAPRLQALIAGLLGVVDDALTQPLATLEAKLSLEGADGVWLDYVGERLGHVRPSILNADFEFFGFEGSSGVGFDQGPFFSVVPSLQPRVAVGDGYYRCLLNIRSRALLADGTVPVLEAMMQVEFEDARIEDHGDGSITVRNIANDPRQNLGDIVSNVIRQAAPAGVAVAIEDTT